MQKYYFALVMGEWGAKVVNAPATKERSEWYCSSRIKRSRQKRVFLEKFEQATLIQASPITDRTHQIRVHASILYIIQLRGMTDMVIVVLMPIQAVRY